MDALAIHIMCYCTVLCVSDLILGVCCYLYTLEMYGVRQIVGPYVQQTLLHERFFLKKIISI